jgi:hypothetical protein
MYLLLDLGSRPAVVLAYEFWRDVLESQVFSEITNGINGRNVRCWLPFLDAFRTNLISFVGESFPLKLGVGVN